MSSNIEWIEEIAGYAKARASEESDLGAADLRDFVKGVMNGVTEELLSVLAGVFSSAWEKSLPSLDDHFSVHLQAAFTQGWMTGFNDALIAAAMQALPGETWDGDTSDDEKDEVVNTFLRRAARKALRELTLIGDVEEEGQ